MDLKQNVLLRAHKSLHSQETIFSIDNIKKFRNYFFVLFNYFMCIVYKILLYCVVYFIWPTS